MTTTDTEQPILDEEHPWSHSKTTKRNYWSRLDPTEFVTYPRLPALSYYEEMTLIRKAQAGDLSARNEVWRRNLRLVFSVVNRFYIPLDLMPDALQEGAMGIQRAILKFDLERYGAFSTYAWPWIWQHIQRFLHYRAFPTRIPAHLSRPYFRFRRDLLRATSVLDAIDVMERWRNSDPSIFHNLVGIHRISTPVAIHLTSTDDHPAYEEHHHQEQLDREVLLATIAANLVERQGHVLIRRFALDGRPESTLEELGAELGLTRERVRQIENQAIDRLKRFFPSQAVEECGSGPRNPSHNGHARDGVGSNHAATRVAADLDRVVAGILKLCSDRQANATVHYFGLFGNRPSSISEIASLLDIPKRKAAVAVKQGRARLLTSLSHRTEPEVQQFVERLHSERSWEDFL